MVQPRTTRADGRATRKRILKAAKSMFAAGGYEATSLRQIAGSADVDLATLKYHFGGKPSLFGEVYKAGHDAFLGVIGPFLATSATVSSVGEVESAIDTLAKNAVDFVTEHEWFARLFLYRLLEDSSDISGLEEQLEGVALGMIDAGLTGLAERGLIREIDVRAFITLLVTGVSMWTVAARHKPHWLGQPNPLEQDGRERFEAFLRSILVRSLIFGDARSSL